MRTFFLLLCTLFIFNLHAQNECVFMGPTSFEKASGDCFIPNSSNQALRTGRAKIQNNCNSDLQLSLKFTGAQIIPDLPALRRTVRLAKGESKELLICNVEEGSGAWEIEDVKIMTSSAKTWVSFTLRNNSLKSIPLYIPGIMNPNLSPVSNSGVSLSIGQEIYFREGRKKYLLLTVDDSIQDGSKLDVAKLISQRKKELGL